MPRKSRNMKFGRGESTKRKKRYKLNKEAMEAALVKDIVIKRPFCTVCKRFQTPEEEMNACVYEDDDSDIEDFYFPGHNRYNNFTFHLDVIVVSMRACNYKKRQKCLENQPAVQKPSSSVSPFFLRFSNPDEIGPASPASLV